MMYLPSSGAMIDVKPSRHTRAASSLTPSSNRLAVQDGDARVELADPQPQALDLGRDPLALLGLDDEVIDVFVVGDAGHRHVHGDRLRGREVVVGLDLGRFLSGRRR